MLWGVRLSLNFARKGGYSGEEDYRWAIVRAFCKKHDPLHPLGQEVFGFAFVAVYQTVLIWSFSAVPAWRVASHNSPLNVFDAVLAVVAVLSLLGEIWTDEAQYAFQSAKHAMTPAERSVARGDFARGFCTKGPFKYSRHLNFFCEQLFWVCIYGFTVSAGEPILNVGGVGCVALVLLFQGSTWFTELITSQKYPEYLAYQLSTSRLLPWLPGPGLDSPEGKELLRKAWAARTGAGKSS